MRRGGHRQGRSVSQRQQCGHRQPRPRAVPHNHDLARRDCQRGGEVAVGRQHVVQRRLRDAGTSAQHGHMASVKNGWEN
eukprot:2802306-Pyramimonas_sp.AAC.1